MELTEAAIPVYFGGMGAEYRWLRRHADERGATPADYEQRDTITSLAMGVGSLIAPLVLPKLLRPITPGRGRFAKALLITAAGREPPTARARTAATSESSPNAMSASFTFEYRRRLNISTITRTTFDAL